MKTRRVGTNPTGLGRPLVLPLPVRPSLYTILEH